ncbi:YcbK family protein [Devosia sp. Naph2]|uniref:YcbK family protein n=1 Tax=Devosia polycyclovorans TaxID=3345148 RepID=UPI0035D058C1
MAITGKVYATWQQFPMSEWRWPNFSPQEMASKREGELMIDEAAMDKLQKLRNILGKPLIITSAYRSAAHNKAVGGATRSQHRLARAFDVRMDNQDPWHFEQVARSVGFTGFGHYPKSGFMHIDTGPARRWNDGSDFPRKNVATPTFPTEPKTESIIDKIGKPEVIIPTVGTGLGAAAPLAQGNGPVQFALAVGIVLVICAGIAWFVMKSVTRPRDV